MFKVLKLNEISPLTSTVFTADYTIDKEVQNPDAIILRSFKMHDYDLPKSVLAVARAGAGTNNIPVEKYGEQGVVVFNTPGANANAVKELVLFNLLVSSRKIKEAIDWTATLKGKGDEVPKLVEANKSNYVGREITGKKIGVIGLGAIGALVANACCDLGMEVLGYDPFISVDGAWNINKHVKKINDINEIFANADYISIHLPLNDNTRSLINKDSISKMKNDIVIINCSRDELVNNDDIIKAVKANKVAKYVTDFPCDKLLGIDNIVCVPHLGASTPEAEDNCAIMAAKELVDYLENGNIINSVNFPAVSMPKTKNSRLCVFHKNEQGMLNKLTAEIGDTLNIENMMNKSKGELSYSMFDVSKHPDQKLIDKLSKISGVMKIRAIK